MRLRSLLILLITFALYSTSSHAGQYPLGPDSKQQPDVPHGVVTNYKWTASKIYPGTVHDYSVYVPSQYKASSPACVMIFQDGGGGMNVPNVFDNLIAHKEMPVTVAIMISPGVVPAANSNALPRYNRSHEYDNPGDDYARFLLDEILPEVGKSLNLSKDPNDRGLAGGSSGGICAFNTAWVRPDQFHRVISYIGSFTDLQGANTYPSQIRKYEPRPLRVFMQDGSHDQDIYSGAWFIANQDVYAALRFAGYDSQFVIGTGGHSGEQGASILPDALRWMWRDYPAPITTPARTNQPIMNILKANEGWQVALDGDKAIGGLATDAKGNVYVSDTANNRIQKIDIDDKVSVYRDNVPSPAGLAWGPDNRLYICEPTRKRVVALTVGDTGRESVAAKGIAASQIVAAHDGSLYFAGSPNLSSALSETGKIWMLDHSGKTTIVDTEGVGPIQGIGISPDQTLLFASHGGTDKYVYSYQRKTDGSLTYKQAYYDLFLPYNSPSTFGGGMISDTQGWLYVASLAGVQMLDQAGRVNGIISNPEFGATTAVTFGGVDFDTIFAAIGGKVYRRKTAAHGVIPFQEPVKPPGPRL